jgi:protease-4
MPLSESALGLNGVIGALIAEGRVWSGKQAHEFGLVDKLGSLNDAIESAAKLAGMEDYFTWHVKRDLTEQEKLLKELFGQAEAKFSVEEIQARANTHGLKAQFLQQLGSSLNEIDNWNDPKHTYANCFCTIQ